MKQYFHETPIGNFAVALYPAATIQQELNNIFGQAAVNWQVTIDPDLPVESIRNKKFEDGGTGLLSRYTGHMKEVFRVYENKRAKIDKEIMYIFLVGNAENTRKEGFMPPKKNCGFLFIDQLAVSDNFHKVLAHELGHGAFHLKHPWSEKYIPEGSQQYNNLMDYTRNGTRLHKYQWDLLHNPAPMLGLFEGEDEGAYDTDIELYQKILQEVRCAYLNGSEKYTSDYLRRLSDNRPMFDVNNLQLGTVIIKDVDLFFKSESPDYYSVKLPAKIEYQYFNPTFGKDYYQYRLGNLYINTDEESPELVSYLQPSENTVTSDLRSVMSGINLDGSNISGKSFNELFAIASCATRYLAVDERIKLIKLIIHEEPILDEDYEDLILDILMTTPDKDARAVYLEIMNESSGLLVDLIRGIDNIGDDEDNYNRLGNEIYRLFQVAYRGEVLPYTQNLIIPVDPSYGSICPYKAEVDRSGFSFTVSGRKSTKIERTVNGYPGSPRPPGYGRANTTAAINTDCGYVEDQVPVTLRFNSIISVVFEEDMLKGQQPRRYRMPAFMYYQIIDARRNQELYKGLDAAWMALGIVTPVDEFYILTKALSFARRAAYTINLAKLKVLLKENKLVLRSDDYDEMVSLSRNVLDDVNQYIVRAGFPDFPRINDLSVELRNVIAEKGWDSNILTQLNNDLANSSFRIGIEGDFSLVDSWKVLGEVGLDDLVNKIDDIKFVDDYLKRNPGKASEVTADIKSKGWQKWVDETNSIRKYSTSIDDAVELLAKEDLFGDDALTFLDAAYRTVKTKNSITLYRSFGAPKAKLGGTFSTPTKLATRNELAILEEWGNSMRFEAKVTVPKDIKLNIGRVAPQTGKDGIVLEGLGEQVILPYKWDNSWVNEIFDTQTGKVYKSLGDFKKDFPSLVD